MAGVALGPTVIGFIERCVSIAQVVTLRYTKPGPSAKHEIQGRKYEDRCLAAELLVDTYILTGTYIHTCIYNMHTAQYQASPESEPLCYWYFVL